MPDIPVDLFLGNCTFVERAGGQCAGQGHRLRQRDHADAELAGVGLEAAVPNVLGSQGGQPGNAIGNLRTGVPVVRAYAT